MTMKVVNIQTIDKISIPQIKLVIKYKKLVRKFYIISIYPCIKSICRLYKHIKQPKLVSNNNRKKRKKN